MTRGLSEHIWKGVEAMALVKKSRRLQLANLPFEEKIRILFYLQEVARNAKQARQNVLPTEINDTVNRVRERLTRRFRGNIKAIVLYGSWVKGTARPDSDVDLLVIYRRRDRKTVEAVDKLAREISSDMEFIIVHAPLKDFIKEKWPVYTAAKKEGKVICGDVDMSMSMVSPSVKYAEFFEKSREFESHKVELAQKLLSDGLSSRVVDYCFVASKHAIQAALAVKGKGYSSKMDVLLPLVKECFGKEISLKLQKLFKIYKKSENISAGITKKDAKLAVRYAKDVLKVYMEKFLSPAAQDLPVH